MVTAFELPALDCLQRGLSATLAESGLSVPIEIVERRRNRHTSTFPSEILACRTADGQDLQLFCKYADAGVNHVFGHRSGVGFEAAVYKDLLGPLDLSTPRYYGQYIDAAGEQTWLVIEYLDELARLNHSADALNMFVRTAEWIGRFHVVNVSRVPGFRSVLHIYDEAYYRGWAGRTLEFLQDRISEFPWLPRLCRRFSDFATELVQWPSTIIHGEFYPKNVLTKGERVCPVDWESAAVAFGEIDLASLTENWPERYTGPSVRAYRQARGNGASDEGFERRLDAARLYLNFRWMGNRPDMTKRVEPWRFEQMRAEGERLGLI